MLKIQGNILTPKGQLAPKARDLITTRLINDFDATGWERIPDQKAWQMQFVDSNGNVVYAVLDLRVTTIDPTQAKANAKASKPKEVIEWC